MSHTFVLKTNIKILPHPCGIIHKIFNFLPIAQAYSKSHGKQSSRVLTFEEMTYVKIVLNKKRPLYLSLSFLFET